MKLCLIPIEAIKVISIYLQGPETPFDVQLLKIQVFNFLRHRLGYFHTLLLKEPALVII